MRAVADPLVTIALPARNAAATLRSALCSLQWQTFESWELLVMDDGSTDETAAVVQAMGDARMRVVADGRHAGLAVRLNQAVDLARGRYLARMDADDIAYPQRLLTQFDFLERHTDVDLVSARALAFRDDGEIIGLLPFRASHAAIMARPWRGIPMPHPTWFGRIEWFRRWRYGVPEAPRAEDQELLMRAGPHSRLAACPEVLLGYRQWPYSLSKTLKGRFGQMGAFVRLATAAGEWPAAALAVTLAVAKAGVDIAAGLPGCDALFLSRMGETPSVAQRAEWEALWQRLKDI